MSDSQRNTFSLSNILFDKDGKFCLPCSAYHGFQYVTTQLTNQFQMHGKNQEMTSDDKVATTTITTTNSSVVSTQDSVVTGPVNDELIPGSRTYMKEDPPDVQKLGAASWTFLHSMAAKYPDIPTEEEKQDIAEFLKLFSHVYPCTWCASDFEKYITKHSPRVESKEELNRWLCEAHNHVNVKLGKPKFDCNFWRQRWKDGWDE